MCSKKLRYKTKIKTDIMSGTDKFAFNILSVNIRGMNDRKKRRNVFRWVKKNKYDICFLQEAHSTTEMENVWKNEWGKYIVLAWYFSGQRSHDIIQTRF